jgi:hypothetical protein
MDQDCAQPCAGPRSPAARASERAVFGLLVLVFIGGLGALAALVPAGHGFSPKGGGWFIPAVVGGAFTLHPLFIAAPWAACFVLGLLDWRRPWRVEHLDLLALAGFFPVAMLLSDDLAPAGLWLAAVCLGWLSVRMAGAALGAWRMPELRPSISSRRLGTAILILLLVRAGSLAGSNILDVGQASSLGAWRILHGLRLYGAVSWQGPGGLQVYRPDSYGPFVYYAYIPFAAIFPPAPLRGLAHPSSAVLATLLPAVCFDALTLAGLHVLGRRLGGRPLAQAFVFAYLLYPFPDLSLMAETNDALIAALCVWTIVVATERPAARGVLMAAAVLTKFVPALLALQFLGEKRGRWRYALALAAALAAMLAWPLITSGPAQFLDSTFGYQLLQRGGGTQFSIWTYLPHAATAARPVLAAALLLLALSPMLRPPAQDTRQHAALAAALLTGAQLLLGYWFYSYLTWCYPLLIIAIIQVRQPGRAGTASCLQVPAEGVPAEDHVEDAAPRAREQADDSPGPLGQITHLPPVGTGQVVQAEARPGGPEHAAEGNDGDQHWIHRACPDHASPIVMCALFSGGAPVQQPDGRAQRRHGNDQEQAALDELQGPEPAGGQVADDEFASAARDAEHEVAEVTGDRWHRTGSGARAPGPAGDPHGGRRRDADGAVQEQDDGTGNLPPDVRDHHGRDDVAQQQPGEYRQPERAQQGRGERQALGVERDGLDPGGDPVQGRVIPGHQRGNRRAEDDQPAGDQPELGGQPPGPRHCLAPGQPPGSPLKFLAEQRGARHDPEQPRDRDERQADGHAGAAPAELVHEGRDRRRAGGAVAARQAGGKTVVAERRAHPGADHDRENSQHAQQDQARDGLCAVLPPGDPDHEVTAIRADPAADGTVGGRCR